MEPHRDTSGDLCNLTHEVGRAVSAVAIEVPSLGLSARPCNAPRNGRILGSVARSSRPPGRRTAPSGNSHGWSRCGWSSWASAAAARAASPRGLPTPWAPSSSKATATTRRERRPHGAGIPLTDADRAGWLATLAALLARAATNTQPGARLLGAQAQLPTCCAARGHCAGDARCAARRARAAPGGRSGTTSASLLPSSSRRWSGRSPTRRPSSSMRHGRARPRGHCARAAARADRTPPHHERSRQFPLDGRLALVRFLAGSAGHRRGLAQAGGVSCSTARRGAAGAGAGATARRGPGRAGARFDVTDRTAVDAASRSNARLVPSRSSSTTRHQRRAPFQDFSQADWAGVMRTNLDKRVPVGQAVARRMIPRGAAASSTSAR